MLSTNQHIDEIKAALLKGRESNFDKIIDADGSKIYDNLLTHDDPSMAHFQTITITGEDLVWKTIVTSDTVVLDEATVAILKKNQIYTDPFSKQKFHKADKNNIIQLYNNTTIAIETLLSPQRITDTSQVDARSYYITEDGYELDENSNFYEDDKTNKRLLQNITVVDEDGESQVGYISHIVKGTCYGTNIANWFIFQPGTYPIKYNY